MRRALVAVPVTVLAVLVPLLAPAYAGKPVTRPPAGVDWDYQLGGSRPVPHHVGVVERDRLAHPVPGMYTICYVNGFQTQKEQRGFWRRHHWGLVLKDHGRAVVDSVWGEWLLDTRTRAKRHVLADIIGRWTTRCARDGFDAVEYDNLDSFSRSHHLLSRKDNKRYAALLVRRAHADGLAAGQKNWAEWDGTVVHYDFAIAEQCAQYDECRSYLHHYGTEVFDVEYRAKAFRRACAQWGSVIPVVRRDVDLTRHGVRRWCS